MNGAALLASSHTVSNLRLPERGSQTIITIATRHKTDDVSLLLFKVCCLWALQWRTWKRCWSSAWSRRERWCVWGSWPSTWTGWPWAIRNWRPSLTVMQPMVTVSIYIQSPKEFKKTLQMFFYMLCVNQSQFKDVRLLRRGTKTAANKCRFPCGSQILFQSDSTKESDLCMHAH